MASEIGVHEKSVRNIVKKLGLRSYKLARGHLLKDNHKALRLQKAAKLERVVFSDEKIFTVMRHHNRQNDRIITKKGLKIQRKVLVQRVQKQACARPGGPSSSS
jgi:hypothetical protein